MRPNTWDNDFSRKKLNQSYLCNIYVLSSHDKLSFYLVLAHESMPDYPPLPDFFLDSVRWDITLFHTLRSTAKSYIICKWKKNLIWCIVGYQQLINLKLKVFVNILRLLKIYNIFSLDYCLIIYSEFIAVCH